MRSRRGFSALALALALAASAVIGGVAFAKDPPKLPEYRPPARIAGSLRCQGADETNALVTAWAEGFIEFAPSVELEIAGRAGGAPGTGPEDALARGQVEVVHTSREFRPEQVATFTRIAKHPPTAIRVSSDSLTVFVHAANPTPSLSLVQLDAIYSTTRKRGAVEDAVTWGALGGTGEWSSLPIGLHGRSGASGSYAFFRRVVLSDGVFKSTVKPGTDGAAVIRDVADDRGGIGYGLRVPPATGVRAIPIAGDDGVPVEPTDANVLAGKYPLSRSILIYVNRTPGKPLPPPVQEFLRYVLSKQGQEVSAKQGFAPLAVATAATERAKLD